MSPLPALEVKKEVITVLREEFLEKIPPESASNLDPLLIKVAKNIEKMLDQKIEFLHHPDSLEN